VPASKRAASSTRRASRAATPAAVNVPAAANGPAVLTAPAINLQRIVQSTDPLGQAGAALESTLTPLRAAAVTKIYAGFDQIHQSLSNIGVILKQSPLPALLLGIVEQPGGTPAVGVQVELDPSVLGGTGNPVWGLTDGAGHFQLTPPPGLLIPAGGLQFTVQGATARVAVTLPANQVASNGALGVIVLPQAVAPMPQSIIASLANIAGGLSGGGQPAPPPPAAAVPTVTLGEDNGCQLTYNGQASIDRFPYGVFFRLVAPQLSIVQTFHWTPLGAAQIPLPVYEGQAVTLSGASSYADRVPVEQPLGVDGFRDQIMGLGPNGTFVSDETVPMAATLGLGYVLRLAQRWTFQGLALGDLVYSLPLAPGEQQQVAVFERTDTASVFESETLSESQAQQQIALSDTSTNATFNSAFNEAASGGSNFTTESVTASAGFNFLVASGGGGASVSNGTSNSWMQGQRDATENAAQQTHSAAENQASARRNAARTGMRLATSSESEQITTRTITNHNHLHALTMQYWQVQRLYDVRTVVEDLDFVCLVPMQIVRFLPPGQPLTVGDPNTLTASRQAVLNRYAAIIKHIDVLALALPRAYQKGLATLRQFAGDPSATVEPYGGAAEDVIQFGLSATVIPGEDVRISAVTASGTRVGPARLTPPEGFALPDNTFQSQDELLGKLRGLRVTQTPLTGALALPPTLDRTQVVGFEITRSFRQIDYTLAPSALQNLESIAKILANPATALEELLGAQAPVLSAPPATVHLNPSQLESELGGPMVFQFVAGIEEFDASGNPLPTGKGESYANDNLFGITLPPTPYPVPALQLAPMLRYNEILTIEIMAQHVVRNTTRYSKTVWASLNNEERAILLDQYTIGVPPNGIADASQLIPLLDCVQNRVLGFFGNSMILPFSIPQSVTDAINQEQNPDGEEATAPVFDPVQIKQSLLAYQQQSFVSPQSIIALPTQGVLGEAVLGHCPSGEKLDLTRFWNWQDSPSDTAPAISPVTLPTTTPSIAATLTAPNTLGQLPSLINNVLSAPTPDTSLLKALSQAAASQKDFDTALTGQAQLASMITNAQNVSNSARADALKAATDLQSQAMATVGNIVGGIYGGNPTAGSSAASAVKGGGSGDSGGSGAKGKGKSTGKSAKGKSATSGNAAGDATGDAGDAAGAAGDAGDAAGAADLAGDAGVLLV
jgi:hypothetical protein